MALPFDVPAQKPMGVLAPDAGPEDDLRRVRDIRDQYGAQNVNYERGLQELIQKYGPDTAQKLDEAAKRLDQQERSVSLLPMNPSQKPTAGVRDPMGRLGTPSQGSGQGEGSISASQIVDNSADIAALLGAQEQGQGQGSGQGSSQGSQRVSAGTDFGTLLSGLAAGAAQAGNMPHFGNALASAAAGGRQATQQAQQRATENALARRKLAIQLMDSQQQEDNLRSGFTRGPDGTIMLQPGYAQAVQKLNQAKRDPRRSQMLGTEEKQALVDEGKLPEAYMRFPVQRSPDGEIDVMTPSGVSLSVSPEGEVSYQSGASAMTTSERSRRSKQVDQSVNVINNLRTLQKKMNKTGLSGVGPVGAFQGLINKTVANFAPQTFSQDRAQFEHWTNLTRENALRVVSDESRFSDTDRRFIMNLFPSTGPFESPQNAASKVKIMTAFFTKRLQDQMEDLDISDVDIDLSPEEVRQMHLNGYLTEDQAADTLVQLYPDRFGGED